MTLLAFLYAVFTQISSELTGNAWVVEALRLTLANLHAIQSFFGWFTLVVVILAVLFAILDRSGCISETLIMVAASSIVIWAVGFLQIFLVGYLAANFTIAGATNPGFWIILILMISLGWT